MPRLWPYATPFAAAVAAVGTAAANGPISGIIYPAPTAALSLTGLPDKARMAEVTTADGLKLKGIVVPARAGRPTLLLFHGNASSAATAIQWLRPLVDAGYGVVSAEYRGYSGNPGKPDEAGLAADADAFFALARVEAGAGPLWIVGHSLGGGVAIGLATRVEADALVTICTFSRLRAMAPRLARALVPDAYDNAAAVAKLRMPFYLIHGTHDAVVPFREGEKLHDAASTARAGGATFAIIGADHVPPAELIAPVLATAEAHLRTGTLVATGLPEPVKLVPFGQSKPLNP